MVCPQDCVATGKVSRICQRKNQTLVRLADLPPENTPGGENYFYLNRDEPNYNALYSLILVAAANRYDLRIRTAEDINDQENAHIEYLVVDW